MLPSTTGSDVQYRPWTIPELMSSPTGSDGQHPVVSHLDANVPESTSDVSVTDGVQAAAACLLLGYAGTNRDVPMLDVNQGVLVSTGDSAHTTTEENVSPDQRVAALINHLEQGGPVPDAQTLIKLLRTLLQARAPQMVPQLAVPCAHPTCAWSRRTRGISSRI